MKRKREINLAIYCRRLGPIFVANEDGEVTIFGWWHIMTVLGGQDIAVAYFYLTLGFRFEF